MKYIKEEIDFIKNNYDEMTVEEIADKLGRSVKGDKLDNSHDNLFVCKDKDHHGRVHAQLEQVAFELVKMGVIKFDHEKGEYFIDKSKLLTRTEG